VSRARAAVESVTKAETVAGAATRPRSEQRRLVKGVLVLCRRCP
jgi:hypothetical protein